MAPSTNSAGQQIAIEELSRGTTTRLRVTGLQDLLAKLATPSQQKKPTTKMQKKVLSTREVWNKASTDCGRAPAGAKTGFN